MRARLLVASGLILSLANCAGGTPKPDPAAGFSGLGAAIQGSMSKVQRECAKAEEENRLEDAARTCTQAIEKEPGSAAAYWHRGRAKLRLGDPPGALGDLERAVQLSPSFAPAYVDRGVARIIVSGGNLDSGLSDFTKATELDPKNAAAVRWKGNALYQKGELDAAVAAYDRSIELEADPNTVLNRGRALASMGQSDRALADFRAVERLNLPDLANGLGYGYLALGHFDEAIAAFRRANDVREVAVNYAGIADALFAQGKYEESIVPYRRAAELGDSAKPGAAAYIDLARACYWAGRYDDALSAIETGTKVASGEQTAELTRERALVYVARGQYQAASDLLGGRPLLGVEISKTAEGIRVSRVNKGASADLAGIRTGDVLTGFNGVSLVAMTPQDLSEKVVATALVGTLARVTLKRADRTVETTVVIGVVPDLPERARAALASPAPGALLAGPSLEVRGVETSPAAIRAGASYDVTISLVARDPAPDSVELPVSFVCSIDKEGRVLHETKSETVLVPNGKVWTILKHLRAVDGKGLFTLKVSLRFGGRVEERSLEIRID